MATPAIEGKATSSPSAGWSPRGKGLRPTLAPLPMFYSTPPGS
uniref:Uncharacterized protein n=1 Tax=Haematococcus lacustris TaxID=44745 RepID=A0A2K9YRS6_HAELA|nr:hypothetical protein SG3EUKT975003.1 [Haematococcus lacustris]AUW36456.1 hypothetical protein SG3EUKT975003.1 [Haematococcus lacustris]